MSVKWRTRMLIGLYGYLFAFYYAAAIVALILLIEWLR